MEIFSDRRVNLTEKKTKMYSYHDLAGETVVPDINKTLRTVTKISRKKD